MGDPRKTRKQFKRPLKIWDKANIEKEKALKQTYGLKNKREIWRTETLLRKKRTSARSLLALPLEERLKREKELLNSLRRIGLLSEKASLDDVLTLKVESFLERRLQTIVMRKGLANTANQARQFLTHGHIAIDGKKVDAPGYIVTTEEESKIGYYAGKKMILKPVEKKEAKKEESKEKTVAQQFEEAKPAAPKENAADVMAAVKTARKAAKTKGEGKPAEAKPAKKKEAKPAEKKKEETAEKKETKPAEKKEVKK